jgi:hypothetical protein
LDASARRPCLNLPEQLPFSLRPVLPVGLPNLSFRREAVPGNKKPHRLTVAMGLKSHSTNSNLNRRAAGQQRVKRQS